MGTKHGSDPAVLGSAALQGAPHSCVPVLRLEDLWFCLKVKRVFFVLPSALWAVFLCLLLQCLG